jgi:hypothetical protein
VNGNTSFKSLGGVVAAVSALAFVWGVNYTSSGANTAFAQLPGNQDSTYRVAQIFVWLGGVGFVIGLLTLLIGRRQSR